MVLIEITERINDVEKLGGSSYEVSFFNLIIHFIASATGRSLAELMVLLTYTRIGFIYKYWTRSIIENFENLTTFTKRDAINDRNFRYNDHVQMLFFTSTLWQTFLKTKFILNLINLINL